MVWTGSWVAERLGVRLSGDPGIEELLGLALRRNPKRAHLLVSHVLGKHVPRSPRLVAETGRALGREVRALLGDAADEAVVLGYAETATALGHCVADGIGTAPYLHSTRRPVPGIAPVGGFEEAHSHATSHLLLPADPGLLTAAGPLVLVDDEFSTGSTVINTLRELHALRPRTRYVVVALTDMRGPADRARLDALAAELGARIDLVAAVAGHVELPPDVLDRGLALVAAEEARQAAEARETAEARKTAEARETTETGETAATGEGAAREAAALRTAGPARTRPVHLSLAPDWPAGLPEGGRHGFAPADRDRLDAALPALAARMRAALPEGGGRLLVLGTEELMYTPLRLAEAVETGAPEWDVCFSTTTRSPVLAVDDPGYAIRTALAFPAHDEPADGPGPRYTYNVAGAGFDAILLVTDAAGDTPALHAPGGLLGTLAGHTPHLLHTTLPHHLPAAPRVPPPRTAPEDTLLPAPLRGPAFSSYPAEDVGWLLQDLSDTPLEAPTEEREEAIQSGGAHYAESLPVEYQPTPAYQRLYHEALEASAARVATAVGTVTETVLAERSPRPVLVSLARAGTPVGVLMRRWARERHGVDVPHYAVSIVRGRGIDANALRWLAAHHDPRDVVFVDGWTGKGAITRELTEALKDFPGFDPGIAVLADPGSCVRTYGTREDFLIPSACLNSTVSGLISRTVLRADLVGPHDFHGAKYYRELAGSDVSNAFVDTVAARFAEVAETVGQRVKELAGSDRAPTWEGWRAVERLSEEYGIHDVNLVKPGVGETTRVLLRRVPWRIVARRDAGADLDHIRLLAAQRGVPVEETDDLPYTCVGLIHPRYTRGATGADGKAVNLA
ncbi:phosphoribosyltransferase [Streptomyces sp. P6-2-1]|uniref:phosphoribosyltransferase n=1 Tax=Streptomyces sp. P6-2-1 TaxID=3422591 RepID=UPI003D3627AE